jgi:hypothetical protein
MDIRPDSRLRFSSFVFLLILCSGSSVWSQSDTSSLLTPLDRTQSVESSDVVTERVRSPLDASETGAQRIVQRRRYAWKVNANYNFQMFYTSDLFLSDEEISEYDGVGILSNSLDVSIVPKEWVTMGYVFTPSIGASWKRLNHFGDGTVNLSGFDFEQHRLYSSLRIRRPNSPVSYYTGIEYSRLYDFNDGEETYTALTPWVSLNSIFQLGPVPFIFNLDARYHDADKKTVLAGYNLLGPDSEDRLELGVNLYSVFNRGRLRAIPFVKLGYTAYTNWPGSSRTDIITAVGSNLSYLVSDLVSLRGFIVYENKSVNESTLDWPNYKKYDLGAGLTVLFQF